MKLRLIYFFRVWDLFWRFSNFWNSSLSSIVHALDTMLSSFLACALLPLCWVIPNRTLFSRMRVLWRWSLLSSNTSPLYSDFCCFVHDVNCFPEVACRLIKFNPLVIIVAFVVWITAIFIIWIGGEHIITGSHLLLSHTMFITLHKYSLLVFRLVHRRSRASSHFISLIEFVWWVRRGINWAFIDSCRDFRRCYSIGRILLEKLSRVWRHRRFHPLLYRYLLVVANWRRIRVWTSTTAQRLPVDVNTGGCRNMDILHRRRHLSRHISTRLHWTFWSTLTFFSPIRPNDAFAIQLFC